MYLEVRHEKKRQCFEYRPEQNFIVNTLKSSLVNGFSLVHVRLVVLEHLKAYFDSDITVMRQEGQIAKVKGDRKSTEKSN